MRLDLGWLACAVGVQMEARDLAVALSTAQPIRCTSVSIRARSIERGHGAMMAVQPNTSTIPPDEPVRHSKKLELMIMCRMTRPGNLQRAGATAWCW